MDLLIRKATSHDLQQICTIYNQGIEDRIATLEENQISILYGTMVCKSYRAIYGFGCGE